MLVLVPLVASASGTVGHDSALSSDVPTGTRSVAEMTRDALLWKQARLRHTEPGRAEIIVPWTFPVVAPALVLWAWSQDPNGLRSGFTRPWPTHEADTNQALFAALGVMTAVLLGVAAVYSGICARSRAIHQTRLEEIEVELGQLDVELAATKRTAPSPPPRAAEEALLLPRADRTPPTAIEAYLGAHAVEFWEELRVGPGPVLAILATHLGCAVTKLELRVREHEAELAAISNDPGDPAWAGIFLQRLEALLAGP